jgi:uncharacterized protein YchJ
VIKVNFEYDEVEQNSLMYAYNDILPYGEILKVTLYEMHCIIYDQYCLKPGCSCTDTVLNIFSVDDNGEIENELSALSVKYNNRKWNTIETASSEADLKSIKSAVEQQYPDIYSKLKKRHLRLRSIYAYNKKRDYSPKQALRLPKVGRNDPCPCGSGKKYKKCCLV